MQRNNVEHKYTPAISFADDEINVKNKPKSLVENNSNKIDE